MNVLYNMLILPFKKLIPLSQKIYPKILTPKPELVFGKTGLQQQENCIVWIHPGYPYTLGYPYILAPRRQAIIWTDAGISLNQTLGTNFSEFYAKFMR